MKRAIILSGVSGTGKTYTRTTAPELKDLPHLDIAEVYREFPEFDWSEALGCLLKRARKMLQEHDTIVIEGYFLPGSTTRKMLVDDLKVAGAKVDIRGSGHRLRSACSASATSGNAERFLPQNVGGESNFSAIAGSRKTRWLRIPRPGNSLEAGSLKSSQIRPVWNGRDHEHITTCTRGSRVGVRAARTSRPPN